VQKHKSTTSKAPLLVQRNKGATGEVSVKVRTVDGTAKEGVHYEKLEDEIVFKNNVTSKAVRISLMQFEKPEDAGDDYSVSFFVDLIDADKEKAAGATLGDITRIEVRVAYAEDDEEEEILTFTDQFRQAMSVNGGEDSESASAVDLTMHYISITWKILAATVPPTHYWGGWPTFWYSMALVGIVTGIIGDIATVFGCIVGLDNEITGIFLVALGTSLPDTFASLLAIKSDENADNAVGNVTGSNSVNVFLGLGMPWLAATMYWALEWTDDSLKACSDITTCTGEENFVRHRWLSTFQGTTGADYAERPPDYRLLTRYVRDKGEEAIKSQAAFLPEYGGGGGFVVIGGKLGFNTFLFSVLCIVAFGCLIINNCRIGHEAAGGPMGNKIIAGIYLTCWAIFIIVGSINVTCDNCLNPFN